MKTTTTTNEWADVNDWKSSVERGTRVKVTGERGVFTFYKVDDDGSICVFGGSGGKKMFRSFRVERCVPEFGKGK